MPKLTINLEITIEIQITITNIQASQFSELLLSLNFNTSTNSIHW